MNIVTPRQLLDIAGTAPSSRQARQKNIATLLADLINVFGQAFGFDQRANLAKFLGQITHESAALCTTTEYASGAAYEGRKDLGNVNKGDGVRFKGRGLIQTTGRDNYKRFTDWAKKNLSNLTKEPVPDFTKTPEKLADFPWAFFSAVYFWDKGNRTGKSLNIYAQQNNNTMITKIINGGTNGLGDRLDKTWRASLILLGYGLSKEAIKNFQRNANITADGLIGDATSHALHIHLKAEDTDMSPILAEAEKIGQEIAKLEMAAPKDKMMTDAKVGQAVPPPLNPPLKTKPFFGGRW